jgi:nitrogen fixation protein FixH
MNAKEIARNPWPYALVAYFAVFITGIVSYTVFASRQRQDLVREDYYEEEIGFQKQVDRVQRSTEAQAKVGFARTAAGSSLVISLPPAHAGRVTAGTIELYRPSDARLDVGLPLAAGADGVQRVDASGLRDGLWKVRVRWTVDRHEFFSDRPVMVGGPNS